MEKEQFYQECGALLGIEYNYLEIYHNKRRTNRWGPREPGNGRFPDFGIIRWFSPTCIHVSLIKPKPINKFFNSSESVLSFLTTL